MRREDIIRMARECGIDAEADTLCRNEGWVEPLEAFAKRVVASIDPKSWMSYQVGFEAGAVAEREACAKVCDSLHDKIELVEKTEHYPGEYGSEYDAGQGNAISECVDAIRARGEK
jgi:hypothetical protein